ncbi:MAG: hypothetical protein WCJ64_01910 [Rhodospirillaceae bacterium]
MTLPAATPVEVRLAGEVKTCTRCSWFWQGTPPYGPYPGFDWNCDFPREVIHTERQPGEGEWPQPKRWLEGVLTGAKLVQPGVMHGCRMAPVMTMGINPNMTAWFASSGGAGWLYPWFASDARYAYYYRHFTLYQESLTKEYVRANIDPAKRLLAEADGEVIKAERGAAHNYMELTVRYQGRAADTVHEIPFTPEERWVILCDLKAKVRKGELLAGHFDPPAGESVEVQECPQGYYLRMVPVLRRFEALAGLAEGTLTVGEDVAQHDMVGCASPGWQDKYDMPTATIARNCVQEKGWAVSQFVQSQPPVLIVVGSKALEMVRGAFASFMTLETDGRDIYQLLEETCLRRTFVTIDSGAVKFRSRLLIVPHFSYVENFASQARLSAKAWEAFQADFAADKAVLEKNKRIGEKRTAEGAIPVSIKGENDPLRADLSISAWQVLMAYYLDPFALMAGALAEEYQQGTLGFDPHTGHLTRAKPSCRYCVNDFWQFPEGCAYRKPDEPAVAPEVLDAAVRDILRRSRY